MDPAYMSVSLCFSWQFIVMQNETVSQLMQQINCKASKVFNE